MTLEFLLITLLRSAVRGDKFHRCDRRRGGCRLVLLLQRHGVPVIVVMLVDMIVFMFMVVLLGIFAAALFTVGLVVLIPVRVIFLVMTAKRYSDGFDRVGGVATEVGAVGSGKFMRIVDRV